VSPLDRFLAVAPVLPGRVRRRAAARAASALVAEGEPYSAAALLARSAARTSGRDALELEALAADTLLRAGTTPDHVDVLVGRLLDAADAALRAGDEGDTVRLLGRVASLQFARARHLDVPLSPLAADPAAFLAPLHRSSSWQRLVAPRGRTRPPRDRGDGPLRVLLVTDDDLRFALPLAAAVEAVDDRVTVRTLRLDPWAREHGVALPLTPGAQVAARWSGAAGAPWATALAAELADCDVVWVEWGQRGAVLVSLLDPGDRRIVVRLHSFEAFTVFPQLIDASHVDLLTVVSPAFAALITAAAPALAGDVRVVPNVVADRGISETKDPGAARTLGLLGWSAPAKDAVWALDLLAALRAVDPSWRLHLVGAPPDAGAGGGSYARAVAERLARPDVADAVDLVGQTDDVAGALRVIGVIVSSSTRESFHVAVAEGVESGARAVVRDWPALAAYGGAHGVWPDAWIVTTVDEAVTRVLGPADDHPTTALPDAARSGAAMAAALRGTGSGGLASAR
jgi:glycosyltransferase involved in cell wall biosynthesis